MTLPALPPRARVVTSGTSDVFHAGHLRLQERAVPAEGDASA